MRQLKARATQRRSERGVVAIITALSLTMLLMSVAMVLDLGAVRIDRQVNKMAADAATTAGLRGLDKGDGYPYSFRGVCQAITYLQLNRPALGTMTYTPCSNTTKLSTRCDKANPSTWADFTTTVGRYTVQVKSPYSLTASGFAEDSLATMAGDTGDADQGGCDQLAVVVTQTHKPAFGRVTSPTDLSTRIRSVGRIVVGKDGEGAASLLLLERNDCGVLQASSTGVFIHVLGNGTVPGLIHSDSLGNGAGCSSNNIIHSQPDYGIVAYESEVSPKQPGIISTVAKSTATGAVPSKAQDAFPKVVAKPDPGGTIGRDLITRSVVDDKYFAGVKGVRDTANALLNSTTAPSGYTAATCTPSATALAAVKVWIDCGNFSPSAAQGRFPNATDVIVRGRVNGGTISLPKALHVYVEGSSSPSGINADQFAMHHEDVATCADTNSPSRAVLVVRQGKLTTSGSAASVQLCHTSVVMLGASSAATTTGCLPSTAGQAYTVTACNGIIDITGGTLRWTAPDAVDSAERTAADYAELEDLALWTEASGSGSKLSANLYLAGVFMLPNAKPFNINGSGVLSLKNSQFISDTLDVTGSGTLDLQPDPHDAVSVPIVGGFTLVR